MKGVFLFQPSSNDCCFLSRDLTQAISTLYPLRKPLPSRADPLLEQQETGQGRNAMNRGIE
jgi:hypothetical protein